jgi:hypothetical protein
VENWGIVIVFFTFPGVSAPRLLIDYLAPSNSAKSLVSTTFTPIP